MKIAIRLGCAAGVLTLALAGSGGWAEETGSGAVRRVPVAAFIDALGVNTHLAYTDGRYLDVDDVTAKLDYLGIDKVRDHNLNPASDRAGQTNYLRAAAQGVRFDMVVGAKTEPPQTVARLETLERYCPGSVVAVEGPNEIAHNPVSYSGLTGDAGAAALQRDLFTAVRASSLLKGARVLSYSLDHDSRPTGGYDRASIHPYPQNGAQPQAWIAREMKLAPLGDRVVITETGYATLPGWWMGVDGSTQARLTLNLLFDAALLGVDEVYLYELLDAYPDPEGKAGEKHYGLFDHDGRPKPVALAIRNLGLILKADPAAPKAVAFPWSFHLAGLPPTASTLILEAADGRTYLAVWNEADVWDEAGHRPIEPVKHTVRLRFDGAAPRVRLFDPVVDHDARALDAEDLGFVLEDRPLLLELSDPARPAHVSAPVVKRRSAPRPCSPGRAQARLGALW